MELGRKKGGEEEEHEYKCGERVDQKKRIREAAKEPTGQIRMQQEERERKKRYP